MFMLAEKNVAMYTEVLFRLLVLKKKKQVFFIKKWTIDLEKKIL